MLRMSAAALLLCVGVSSVVWAAGDDYRLSGIIWLDSGERRAVIKPPQGNQGIYRTADEVHGNPILEVGDRWVRIQFPDGERRLSLAGDTTVVAPEAAEANPPIVSFVEVTPGLIDRLGGVASRRGKVSDHKSAYRKLNVDLGLPAGARIVAIDGEPVQSPEQMTERLGGMLRDGHVPMKLEFEDRAGTRREVYFTSEVSAEPSSGAG